MPFASQDFSYDLLAHVHELMSPIDVHDSGELVRRAIERQAFSAALYYPRLSDLDPDRKAPDWRADMMFVARRHAALLFYERDAARMPTVPGRTYVARPNRAERRLRLKNAIRRSRVLSEYLQLCSGGLGALQDDPSQSAYANELQHQFAKSIAVAILIDGYMTNGEDLPNTCGRRPRGIKIMREALLEADLINISERTLAKYFDELEPTSVFHYLMWYQDCMSVLRPWNPCNPNFIQGIMRRARSTDELMAVCQLHNTVVSELNEKYRFAFCTIENVPKPETKTDYDSLARDKPNPKLTEAIKTVIGRTG
jgi:hypothetical protein